MIHPTAIISPGAQLDSSVEVGPFSVIDGQVSLGAGLPGRAACLFDRAHHIGPDNRFHAHCVIGDAPQDVKYKDEPTGLRIGAHNLFREGAPCIAPPRPARTRSSARTIS
jgi:UDP-N-acetylglucosamine acyltransferase